MFGGSKGRTVLAWNFVSRPGDGVQRKNLETAVESLPRPRRYGRYDRQNRQDRGCFIPALTSCSLETFFSAGLTARSTVKTALSRRFRCGSATTGN